MRTINQLETIIIEHVPVRFFKNPPSTTFKGR
jgi:hypothetical protein